MYASDSITAADPEQGAKDGDAAGAVGVGSWVLPRQGIPRVADDVIEVRQLRAASAGQAATALLVPGRRVDIEDFGE